MSSICCRSRSFFVAFMNSINSENDTLSCLLFMSSILLYTSSRISSLTYLPNMKSFVFWKMKLSRLFLMLDSTLETIFYMIRNHYLDWYLSSKHNSCKRTGMRFAYYLFTPFATESTKRRYSYRHSSSN